ncbi:hypothetical protein D9601_12190 [Sphingomonas sp. MA1305]|uniref:AAA family ATPase n=1 Tax=Sphingomonas sp. MA1305 TaxID=2479204 RepID=UPI0018DF5769|nr:AAA family ATPase [Sphingomonas sp. MA1305]MBI0476110.1 hypothetical protein [Sphingomonas sp. MA1305]
MNISLPADTGNSRLARALQLAQHGFAVLPVRPDGSKAPYADRDVAAALGISEPGSSEGGVKLASCDTAAIGKLWARFPDASVGIATGSASGGLYALDVDRKNGKDGAATLASMGHHPPETQWQATPSGGWHYLYRSLTEQPLSSAPLGIGLDRRGDGTFIVDYGTWNPALPLAPAPMWLFAAGRTGERLALGTNPAPSFEIATAALNGTDNPDDYDTWRNITSAYRQSVTGLIPDDQARATWEMWCANYPKNDLADNAKLWRSLDRGTSLGWSYLQGQALRSGNLSAHEQALVQGFSPTGYQVPPGASATPLPASPPPAIWFAASDLSGPIPPREWLVPDVVPLSTVTMLGGDGGTGKSLIALQLALSVACGQFWLNRVPKSGPALYLSAEDDRDELHRRIAAIAAHSGSSMADLGRLRLASLAGCDALLALAERNGTLVPTDLYRALDAQIAADKPALVVLDTLADLFPGNENDRAQARQFIGLLRGLAIRHHCAVLLLAHPSLTGIATGTGASGSTAWNNSVRSRLYFERIVSEGYEADPDARRLKVMKSNYGRIGAEIAMTWRSGVFVADTQAASADVHAKADRVFLTLIERNEAQGRRFSTLHAPKELSGMPDAEGCTKRALKGAMERLLADGKLALQQIRENGRDRTVIGVCR